MFCLSKERYISFLDILGFSDIVMNGELDKILKKMRMIMNYVPIVESLGKVVKKGEKLVANRKLKKCSCFSFSDTFIIITQDISKESLNIIISATFQLARGLFASGFPIRGAITKGEADYIENTNHLIGKAIIKAAKLEKKQNWFGITIDSEVLSQNNIDLLNNDTSNVISEYDVPLKNKTNKRYYVINWRLNLWVKDGIESLLPKPFDDRSKLKFDNTLKFSKYIRETKQAYKQKSEDWLHMFYVSDGPPTKIISFEHGDEY